MPLPAPERYTATAIILHWLLALMIVISFSVGVYMVDLPKSERRWQLYDWHEWNGLTILTLSALRLLWRLVHRPPPDLPMPAWQRRAAHSTHIAMYVLFFAVPLVGWAMVGAAGHDIVWYGVLPMPNLVGADKALAETLKAWHEGLAIALAGLVVLHVAATLKHHLIDRDNPLRRMALGLRASDQHDSGGQQ